MSEVVTKEFEKRFLTEDEKREKFPKVLEIIKPYQSSLYAKKHGDKSLKAHIELILNNPENNYPMYPLSDEEVGYIKGYLDANL